MQIVPIETRLQRVTVELDLHFDLLQRHPFTAQRAQLSAPGSAICAIRLAARQLSTADRFPGLLAQDQLIRHLWPRPCRRDTSPFLRPVLELLYVISGTWLARRAWPRGRNVNSGTPASVRPPTP